jgi:hypothetical protein
MKIAARLMPTTTLRTIIRIRKRSQRMKTEAKDTIIAKNGN